MTKTIDTLVEDIYNLMTTKNTVDQGAQTEELIEQFGENMKSIMRKEFVPGTRTWDGRKLRLSALGHPDRKQWYSFNKHRGEKLEGSTLVMFLYGHLVEEMILFLTRLSGHTVTDEQKLCEVDGIRGAMDCRIDGTVVDVKSTSGGNFKKFSQGTLAAKDDYGYIDQLKAYAHSEGERAWAWLAMDKSTGKLAVLKQDLDDTDDPMHEFYSQSITERVAHVKETVKQEEKPDVCYPLKTIGKSGNTKLDFLCGICQYKKLCYPDLKAFEYSYGTEYLVDIVKEPKVAPTVKLDKGF